MKKCKQVFYEEKKRNFKMLKDCTCEGLKHWFKNNDQECRKNEFDRDNKFSLEYNPL